MRVHILNIFIVQLLNIVTLTLNGQITSFNGMALSWDYLGLLGSAGSNTYIYDTSGRRLSKTTNGTETKFYYAGDLLVGQKTGNNKIEFIYDSNGDYYGFEYNDVPYNYIKNLQGDVIAIANGGGSIIARYEYDAWGRILSTTDTSGINIATINPIRYRGYYYDTETGFYYHKTRYYSPEICRFLSADRYLDNRGVNTHNLFAYCANNPVCRIDVSGAAWETIWDFVSLVFSIVDVCSTPESFMSWLGLAFDAVSLVVPFVPAVSGSLKVIKNVDVLPDTGKALDTINVIEESIDSGTDVSKIGWHLGDPIENLTKAGKSPSWTTVRQRYWKNEALFNSLNYSQNDLARMRLGLAPIGNDGFSIELHHTYGRNGANFYTFEQLTRTEHFLLHYGAIK